MDREVDEVVFGVGILGAGLAIVAVVVSAALVEGPRDILQSGGAAQAARIETSTLSPAQNLSQRWCPKQADHRLLATVSK